MNPIVFLGGGRITSALIAGLCRSGYRMPLIVHDRNRRKLHRLQREFGVCIEPDLRRAQAQAGTLIVAVRPGSVRDLLQHLDSPDSGRLGISLAAGVPIAKLREWVPSLKWMRAMPSPVCRSGSGLTALTWGRGVSRAMRTAARLLFARVGDVVEIPERRFDAFTVTYSSSHGYHALAALAESAVTLGLDRKTAMTAAVHALADGIRCWKQEGLSLETLLHEAATPGGVAAATIKAMDAAGYQKAVRAGLRAGLARARKNIR